MFPQQVNDVLGGEKKKKKKKKKPRSIITSKRLHERHTHLLQTGGRGESARGQGQVVGRGRESLQLGHAWGRGRGAGGGALVLEDVQNQSDVLSHLPLQSRQLPVNTDTATVSVFLVSQPVSQSVSQSVTQSVRQPASHPVISQSVRSVSHPVSPSVTQSVRQSASHLASSSRRHSTCSGESASH